MPRLYVWLKHQTILNANSVHLYDSTNSTNSIDSTDSTDSTNILLKYAL